MGSEWRKVKLSEIGKIVTGKTPSTKNKENFGDKYPFITPRDMRGQKYIRYTERYLSDIGFNLLKSIAIPPNSICVTCIGSMGKIAMSSKQSITNQQINSIIPNDEYDPSFIYYCLKPKEDYFKSISSGTTMPILNKTDFSNIEIEVPPLPEQQKIASILSAFDDKIELNNEMNKTLEEIAQVIFKHWFIDFEFPNENGEPYKSSGGEFVDSELGLIPKGWKVKSIGELVDFTISGDWGNDERSQDYDKKCFCIRGADFPPIVRGDKTNIPVRFLKRSSFEKRRLKHGDILIEVSGGTKGRPTGRTVFVHRNLIKQFDESLVFSNFCRLIRVNDILNSIILFLYLQFIYNKGKMTQYEIQSTGISNFQLKYFFENEKLAVAPIEIQEKFINLVEPIFDKKYTFENYYLSQLRDTLLPKLISGEIRVM